MSKPKRSVGTKIKVGLNYIAGLTSIGAPTRTAETLDTTTLDSPGGYREFTGGFKDGGEVAIAGYFEPGDSGQIDLDDVFESGNTELFEIIYPPDLGAGYSFIGIVTAITAGNAELEELLGFEATIKVSGPAIPTKTPSAGLSALSLSGVGGALSPVFANDVYFYTFDGVTGASTTITATAANHTLKLYVDGIYQEDLTSAVASAAIPLELGGSTKLTIIAQEEGKTPIVYEIVVVKTA